MTPPFDAMTDPTRRTPTLELHAWRSVSRHGPLREVMPAIEALLRVEIDATSAILVRADADVLSAFGDSSTRAWVPGERDDLRARLDGDAGDHASVVLAVGGDPPMLLVVRGRFEASEARAVLPILRDPLRVALANDARARELERLRDAVAQDERALLSRPQHQDVAESVVGAETGLRSVMQRVEQVAPTEAPVLILGETGSGKEVVARAIHARSRRANGPFLRVNCGAIPPELVDSELFGHERGSFTGAINTRKGWFERADGGTLLLDEVAELPPAAQVRLLRVLQDGSFERVGGQQPMNADVRIVAATHRDVQTMIAADEFREDLWYRISVFPIQLPPLRERRQDIAPLARHFAARASQRLHGVALEPDDEDIELLMAYRWPGNVRELSTVVERAAILGNGLCLDIRNALGVLPSESDEEERGSLVSVTRRAIESALERTGGRIEGEGGAARALGIHPATLRSRMRKLRIDWQRYRRGSAR